MEDNPFASPRTTDGRQSVVPVEVEAAGYGCLAGANILAVLLAIKFSKAIGGYAGYAIGALVLLIVAELSFVGFRWANRRSGHSGDSAADG